MNSTEAMGAVLVVDDNLVFLECVSYFVSRLGYSVLSATRGLDAVAVYKKHREEVRLVILDMDMPDINGDKVFQELKTVNPDVKVLCNSGCCDPSVVRRMLTEGLWKFIQKPYTFSDFKTLVQEAMTP
jgi:two-component system, cell cycle sensor histidine kinase and response regulator CckA